MTYQPLYHPFVPKEDLPGINKDIQKRIKKAIEERLLEEPTQYEKPLRYSFKSLWVLRIGDYRVIYKIEGNTIAILKIDHRKEVYQGILSRLPF